MVRPGAGPGRAARDLGDAGEVRVGEVDSRLKVLPRPNGLARGMSSTSTASWVRTFTGEVDSRLKVLPPATPMTRTGAGPDPERRADAGTDGGARARARG